MCPTGRIRVPFVAWTLSHEHLGGCLGMSKNTKIGVAVLVVILAAVAVFFALRGGAKYEDGVYVGYSDGNRRGYLKAEVTIEDDKIVNVTLTELTQTGTPKDESYPWPQWHEAMKVLPERFVAANSTKIDTIAGATGTVDKAIQAVDRALDKALVDKGNRKYQDGTFYGISTDTSHSTGVAWVTIKDDKIVAVEVDEFLEDGSWKDWPNYPWKQADEARAIYAQRFIDAQGPDIDTVSEATGSGLKYIQAVEKALAYATR